MGSAYSSGALTLPKSTEKKYTDEPDMKIFIPLSDAQLDQLMGHEKLVPYQPGCLTLSRMSPTAAEPEINRDPAPADRPALRRAALLSPR